MKTCKVRERINRLENKPTTDNGNRLRSEGLPEKIILLRQKLNEKARTEPTFKFYALYDRVYRLDVLETAYRLARANKGSAGIDGITFGMIEKDDVDAKKFLTQIHEELKEKRYKASPVKRVYIPKANGKQRPLGIPTIKDRVVQMAVLLIIEPIFEADFRECSYGFRPGRSAHDALTEIREHLQAGFIDVYDADLKGYFDSIPHDKLMLCVEQRVVDRSVLKLIRMWLKAPVVETPKGGKPQGKRSDKGTPQGGVISPLLSNLYLHHFDKYFHSGKGAANWANAKLVRYADDFVVMARYQTQKLSDFIESFIEGKMKLEINHEKTKVINLREEKSSLDFLGFTFRFDRDIHSRKKKYLNVFPSKKTMEREKEKLRLMTNKSFCFMPLPMLIMEVNRHLYGWKNYFNFGYPKKEFRMLNSFVRMRLTKHTQRRSQRPFQPPKGKTYYAHFKNLNLVYL